jgi:hypothetical protein
VTCVVTPRQDGSAGLFFFGKTWERASLALREEEEDKKGPRRHFDRC